MNDPEKKEKEEEKSRVWIALGLAWNVGYMIVIPMILFGVGGVLLDKYWGTTPIFIFVGFLLGMTSAMIIVFKKTKDLVVTGVKTKREKDELGSSKNHKS